MSKVTHLPKNFYEQFYGAAELLQQELYGYEYRQLYSLIKRKNLTRATRYLEDLYEERNSDISFYMLDQIRKKESRHDFTDIVVAMVDRWMSFSKAISYWLYLMRDLGGSKNAQKLVRKQHRQLPAPEPWKILEHAS